MLIEVTSRVGIYFLYIFGLLHSNQWCSLEAYLTHRFFTLCRFVVLEDG